MKNKLSNLLKTALEVLQVMLFNTVMIMGFWVIYGMIWFELGLTSADWALWLLFGIACVSHIAFCSWIYFAKKFNFFKNF